MRNRQHQIEVFTMYTVFAKMVIRDLFAMNSNVKGTGATY